MQHTVISWGSSFERDVTRKTRMGIVSYWSQDPKTGLNKIAAVWPFQNWISKNHLFRKRLITLTFFEEMLRQI